MWLGLLTLLLFFIAAIAGDRIKPWTRRGRRGPIYALAASTFSILLILFLPIHGFATEIPVALVATVALTAILSVHIVSQDPQKSLRWGCAAVIAIFLIVPVLMFWDWRTTYFSQLRWHCNGKITNIYHSHNHGVPALDVTNTDGTTTTLENVAPDLFNRVKVGDTLSKSANTANGLLNNTPVRIAPKTFFH